MGKGEIGTAMGSIAEDAGFCVEYYDPNLSLKPSNEFVADIIHICFPLKNIEDMDTVFNFDVRPNAIIIIDATIPLGLAPALQWKYANMLVFHTPCRGRHPFIKTGLLKYVKMVGPADVTRRAEVETFCKFYYEKCGIHYRLLTSSEETAAGKLWDTSWFYVQIALTNEIALYCMKNHLKFDDVYTAFQETADTGKRFEYENGRAVCNEFVPRPIMIPGPIGGHCLRPNVEILKEEISPALYSWLRFMHDCFEKHVPAIKQNSDIDSATHNVG